MRRIEWIIYGPLAMTPEEAGKYTPHELVSLWHGYLWRKQERENMLASLVTVWIANSAGKSYKKRITVKDVFADGRFQKKWTAADDAIVAEMERKVEHGGERD